jgi:hypothetical protein
MSPEFNELFTNWLRTYFASKGEDDEFDAKEDRFVYVLSYGETHNYKPGYHIDFWPNKERITPDPMQHHMQLYTLRVGCRVLHDDVIEAFKSGGLREYFEMDLIAELGFDYFVDDDGTDEVIIDPCVDVFQSPIAPIFFDINGGTVHQLTKDAEEILTPAITWSMMVGVRNADCNSE